MTTATASRKSFSIHDYPEHLNPFREDDNHNKIRFWTIGRRLSRSNSITFSGIKELKNSWALRSFMKKGKKKETPNVTQNGVEYNTAAAEQDNEDSSPIMFRRAMQYSSMVKSGSRSTVGAPERYVYGGSVTPLPRSRFQERLRSSSQNEVSALSMTPRMSRSEVSDSRFSVESANPFDEPPVPPVRASRRKKKKAPLPPPSGPTDTSVTSESSDLHTSIDTTLEKSALEESKVDGELDLEDMNLNIELKIVEDEDYKTKELLKKSLADEKTVPPKEVNSTKTEDKLEEGEIKNDVIKTDSLENILNSVEFPKVDIIKYRRNSSVNEDDVRLRRGNLEDFQALSYKRSKSLTNTFDGCYVGYDINLNETDATIDTNGNAEPQKVICKMYNDSSRKHSIDTVSSTEKEFMEIDKVRREFESEINKLNAALEEDFSSSPRLCVTEIKRKFDNIELSSPNPIPKPRRSHNSDSGSPVNGNIRL